jgi:hypothetical protein
MKVYRLLSVAIAAVVVSGSSGCSVGTGKKTTQTSFNEITTLGKLTVGKTLPSYVGGSNSGKGMGIRPSMGNYLVHVLHPQLPAACVDEECGTFAREAKKMGIQIFGGSDLKLADQIFGIFPADTDEEFQKQSKDYGVLVLSDKQGKVLAIFNAIELTDVSKILLQAKQLQSS